MNMQILNDMMRKASKMAKDHRHDDVYKIHILAQLIQNGLVQKMIQRSQCNINVLAQMINNAIVGLETVNREFEMPLKNSEDVILLCQMALEKAKFNQQSGIELFNILESFLEFPESDEYFFLVSSGFDPETFKADVKLRKGEYSQFATTTPPQGPLNKSHAQQKNSPEMAIKELDWIRNMNEDVLKAHVDPMIGREEEVSKLIHTLSKKKKSNAILVGDPGVGKTSIVEGFAKQIVEHKVPKEIQHFKVYSLDINALMSQTSYRGQLEQKIKETLEILKKIEGAVLFIDEVHMVIGAGASGDSSMSVGNVLKPIMTSGEIRFIGATTYKEYSNHFEKDGALNRRFQKLDVSEPSVEDSIKILSGLQSGYESFHKVKYMSEAIESAVKLSVKYVNGRFLPDKAIDILDEAGTLVKFDKDTYKGIVSPEVIRKIVSKIARIPEEAMTEDVKSKVENLSVNLNKVIFGQNEAVDKIVDVIQVSKAGLSNQKKPIGSFMFAGPTGVGKTELSNQLSKLMSMNMTRIDMSEFKEEHSVSKLIGSPPGYVGFDQEGQLTGAVLRNPNSVILLDEIEKAHPKVLDLLLQVLDYGTLTDGQGRKADFKQAVIICTTNVGTEEITKSVIGMTEAYIEKQRDPLAVVKQSFRPEFLNRFDSIVWFNSLNKNNIKQVLSKHLAELESLLAPKNIKLSLSEESEDFIINKGYSPQYGARPMERVFQEEIKKPLSKEILFGKLQNGGQVSVLLQDNKIVFKVKQLKTVKEKGKDKNGISV